MTQSYNLIASIVYGNALGVVLEPKGIEEYFADVERPMTWQVRVGPLLPEAVTDADDPEGDYREVVSRLVTFCEEHGVRHGFGMNADPTETRPPKWLRKRLTE